MPPPGDSHTGAPCLTDALGRALRDLRISVTDRCNFRCGYCMPKEVFGPGYRFLPHSALLDFDEITRLARLFTQLGVVKLRLTGGEPLLRRDLPTLVAQLAALRTAAGAPVVTTLTTNGSLLARHARALRDAGLTRLTVSLDAIDDTRFAQINAVDYPVAEVLAGVDAALAAGFGPIKINMVVQRGVNDEQIVPLAGALRARYGAQAVLRCIEFMDVGSTNGWRLERVVPSREVLAKLNAQWPLEPLPATSPGETATRYAYADGQGEVGLISSVTQPFCGDCNRARLSTDGRLYTCLFAADGLDLRGPLRGGASDSALRERLASAWRARRDRYSELRSQGMAQPATRKVEMHFIGG